MSIDWIAVAGIASAIGTLTVAGIAIIEIRKTREAMAQSERQHHETLEEREKERIISKKANLLDEIIGWASDIQKAEKRAKSKENYDPLVAQERVARSGGSSDLAFYTHSQKSTQELITEFEHVSVMIPYIKAIATNGNLGAGIAPYVDNAAEKLMANLNFMIRLRNKTDLNKYKEESPDMIAYEILRIDLYRSTETLINNAVIARIAL